jgi:hypothetical protein
MVSSTTTIIQYLFGYVILMILPIITNPILSSSTCTTATTPRIIQQQLPIPGILNPISSPAHQSLLKLLQPFDEIKNPIIHRPLHLIWISLTGSTRLGSLYSRNLRNFILIHASEISPIFIWSNELSNDFIQTISKESDDIQRKTLLFQQQKSSLPSSHVHLIRYDLLLLMKNQPGFLVALRIIDQQFTLPRLFAIHTSDLLRYFLLWKFGGFYSDLDILPLRPLLTFPPGWVSVDTTGTSNTTCVTPPVQLGAWSLNCLCNGLLVFNRGDVLLRHVLETAHTYFPHPYHQYGYGVIGAILVLNSLRHFPDYYELRPVTGNYAMCNAFKDEYGEKVTNSSHFIHLRRRCLVAHIYGQGQSDMEIKGGPTSLLGKLYSSVEQELSSSKGDGVLRNYDP